MQYSKFSFLVLFICSSLFAQKFMSKDCLDASFSTNVKSQGKFFGLIKNNISINKDKCKMTIKHEGILDSTWNIDICREPIHMKVLSKGSENVFKRTEDCSENSTSDYCYYLKELKTNISDYGLIFAEGLREKLKDPHGQVYCVSLLVNRYFDDEVIFSLFHDPKDIYSKETEACALPVEKNLNTSSAKPISSSIEMKAKEVLDSTSKVDAPVEEVKTEVENKF